MTNSTPGPWTIHTEAEHNMGRTTAVYVCRGDEPWPNGQLARVNTADELGSQIANAHLIAASPRMYAALAGCIATLDPCPQRDEAEATLAEARGESYS